MCIDQFREILSNLLNNWKIASLNSLAGVLAADNFLDQAVTFQQGNWCVLTN